MAEITLNSLLNTLQERDLRHSLNAPNIIEKFKWCAIAVDSHFGTSYDENSVHYNYNYYYVANVISIDEHLGTLTFYGNAQTKSGLISKVEKVHSVALGDIHHIEYMGAKIPNNLIQQTAIHIDYWKELPTKQILSADENLNERIENGVRESYEKKFTELSLKEVLPMLMADIDINLLKLDDQLTDKQKLFSNDEIRKQLFDTLSKFSEAYKPFLNIPVGKACHLFSIIKPNNNTLSESEKKDFLKDFFQDGN